MPPPPNLSRIIPNRAMGKLAKTIRFRIPTSLTDSKDTILSDASEDTEEVAEIIGDEQHKEKVKINAASSVEDLEKQLQKVINLNSDNGDIESQKQREFRSKKVPIIVVTKHDDERRRRKPSYLDRYPHLKELSLDAGNDAKKRDDAEIVSKEDAADLYVPGTPQAFFPDEFTVFLGSCRGLMDTVWGSQMRQPIKMFLDSIPPKDEGKKPDAKKKVR